MKDNLMASQEGLPRVEEIDADGPFTVGVIPATNGEEAFADFDFS